MLGEDMLLELGCEVVGEEAEVGVPDVVRLEVDVPGRRFELLQQLEDRPAGLMDGVLERDDPGELERDLRRVDGVRAAEFRFPARACRP